MRVFRHWQWFLGAGLLFAPAWAGCSLNPQPLPPELANDSGTTSYGDDAAGGAQDGSVMDATKGIDAADSASDAPIEAGEAGDASSDAIEEGG